MGFTEDILYSTVQHTAENLMTLTLFEGKNYVIVNFYHSCYLFDCILLYTKKIILLKIVQ